VAASLSAIMSLVPTPHGCGARRRIAVGLLYAFQLHRLRTVGALEMLVNDEGGLPVMIQV
jgi:hypothetical protein